jgi:membrane complex biogenesis BtpA family protein
VRSLFGASIPRPSLVGMIHLAALPGAPHYGASFSAILDTALRDAEALSNAGFDAIMVENYHDVPFYRLSVPAITIASMTRCIVTLRNAFPRLPIGVNVLRNDGISALSIAHACDADFIRVNVLTGAAVTDQGLIQGDAAELIRTRSALQSKVQIFADVGVKHAAPLGAFDLAQTARDTAYRGQADGLIVSGIATGSAANPIDLQTVRAAVPDRPLIVGSGVSIENVHTLDADCYIVGTSIKASGRISLEKARALVDVVKSSK